MQIIQFGYGRLGKRVAQQLFNDQHQLDVYRYSDNKAKFAHRSIQCDVSQPFALEDKAYDAAIIILSPKSLSVADYRDVFVHGVDHILAALNQLSTTVKHLFIVSSTRVFPQNSEDFLNEASPTYSWDEKAGILIEMENKISQSQIPASIIRLAGLYGASERMIKTAQKVADTGMWPELKWTNRIHIDDAARLIATLCDASSQNHTLEPIYNGVDNVCASNHEVIDYVAQQYGFNLPPKLLGQTVPKGKKVKSEFINNLISLNFPSYKEGYNNKKV